MKNILLVFLMASVFSVFADSFLLAEYQKQKSSLEKKWETAETQIAMNCVMGELAELATDYMYRALDFRLSNIKDSAKRIALLQEQSEWDWYCNRFDGESKRGGSIFPMLQGAMHSDRCEKRAKELLLADSDYATLKEIQQLSVPYGKSERTMNFSELIENDLAIAYISDFGKIGNFHYAVIKPTKYLCSGEENPSANYLVIWNNGNFYASYLIGNDVAIGKITADETAITIIANEKGNPISRTFPLNQKQINDLKFTSQD